MSCKNIIFFIVVSIAILFVIEFVFYLDDKNIVHENEFKTPDTENSKYVQKDSINISLEQINSLNIIINDSKTSENFINAVCEELDKDGIRYLFTKNSENVDVDDAVVITLDQEYSAGPSTIIIAPYENSRLGNSDALALAAKTAFYEKGFIVDEVISGKVGFNDYENVIINQRVPTETEEVIGKDKKTSFVTISFGSQNTNASLVTASIENMLVRYYSYITGNYGDIDLLYRFEQKDSYNSISEKLDTTINDLFLSNDDTLLINEFVRNPKLENIKEFDKHVPINLYIEKTLWSK